MMMVPTTPVHNSSGNEMSDQQPVATNDRPRTYWTPAMERYFIDLMLEQLHRGNRSGHTFTKQAWTDMMTVFNSKFGSQYDKDALKSRYTNLWKQFNDVKTILGQNGFSWDETRQMVVADDDFTWNAYVKAHPDARCYRTKPVLNFNDLCIIYGYTTADGRYSRSSHDMDFEDEVQGLKVGGAGDAMGSVLLQSGNSERVKAEWNADMDQYFIELMVGQIGRGNKVNGRFSKQAWTDMLALFNAKFGSQHVKRVLRHRYKKLLKYYGDLKVLLRGNGFSWDHTQQMIIADDNIWDSYIKAHPHARSYRMKTLPNYNDLVLIFGDAIDDGVDDYDLHQDRDLDAGISGLMDGEENVEQTLGSNDRTRTYWTPPMDHYFIDLLLEQVERGNKLGQTFITQAWIDMIASFNSKFEFHLDKEVLKNRYKHLRRLFNEITILLNRTGFSWDETREMITAEEHIWDAYTKEHPDARSYRIKTIPSYQKLCAIFKQENSNGRYSRLAQYAGTSGSSEAAAPLTMAGNYIDLCHIQRDEALDTVIAEMNEEELDFQMMDEDDARRIISNDDQKKRGSTDASNPGGHNCIKVQKVDKETKVGSSKQLDPAAIEKRQSSKKQVPIEAAIDILQAIPEMDDDLLLDACDLLEDDKKAKTFLALDGTLRKKWLLRKLRPQAC